MENIQIVLNTIRAVSEVFAETESYARIHTVIPGDVAINVYCFNQQTGDYLLCKYFPDDNVVTVRPFINKDQFRGLLLLDV